MKESTAAPVPADTLPRAVTISDVAVEARVARSTVSRALNNPGRVNARTQQHIQAVADRLGYRPNPVARALGRQRTDTLALLVPDILNPFYFGIIRGAEWQAAAAGYSLILADSRQDPDREESRIHGLTGAVDGFILGSTRLHQTRVVQLAAEYRIVLINRQVPGVASVVVDATVGPANAMEHLASLGHRHIAYLGGTPKSGWHNTRRWRSIQESGRRLGVTTSHLGPFPPAQLGGAAGADAAIADHATGVIAFNDLLAFGVLQRLAERGLSVPADMSVVGFDDIPGADVCTPTLTTLAAPREELGRSAVQLIIAAQQGRVLKPRNVVLPSHLIVRGSTGPVAVAR